MKKLWASLKRWWRNVQDGDYGALQYNGRRFHITAIEKDSYVVRDFRKKEPHRTIRWNDPLITEVDYTKVWG